MYIAWPFRLHIFSLRPPHPLHSAQFAFTTPLVFATPAHSSHSAHQTVGLCPRLHPTTSLLTTSTSLPTMLRTS